MARMTKEEKVEWDELYQYVKVKIMKYNDDQALSKQMVLKLKGLQRNQYVANNNQEATANYSFKVILYTFKAYSQQIDRWVSTHSFTDENHKFNSILCIVREHINDVYKRFLNAKKTQEKTENMDMSNLTQDKADYKRKTTDMSDKQAKKLEEYW